jgi:hypothetical protein
MSKPIPNRQLRARAGDLVALASDLHRQGRVAESADAAHGAGLYSQLANWQSQHQPGAVVPPPRVIEREALGLIVHLSKQIIGDDWTVEVLEPGEASFAEFTHSATNSSSFGRRNVFTSRYSPTVEALPPMSVERAAAAVAVQTALRFIADRAIQSAFPGLPKHPTTADLERLGILPATVMS